MTNVQKNMQRNQLEPRWYKFNPIWLYVCVMSILCLEMEHLTTEIIILIYLL